MTVFKAEEVNSFFSELCKSYLIYNASGKNMVEKNKYVFTVEEQNIAENKINECLCDLLNKLEYFCICFNSGIADEDTVYQSLHNAFFSCVHMLYIPCFYNNTSESDRLFSNVSSLYLKWKARNLKLTLKEKQDFSELKRKYFLFFIKKI